MLDVARWLADQGLGHHAEVFAKTTSPATSWAISPTDLKELGLSLGDRKRLLKADRGPECYADQDRPEAAE